MQQRAAAEVAQKPSLVFSLCILVYETFLAERILTFCDVFLGVVLGSSILVLCCGVIGRDDIVTVFPQEACQPDLKIQGYLHCMDAIPCSVSEIAPCGVVAILTLRVLLPLHQFMSWSSQRPHFCFGSQGLLFRLGFSR